MRRNTASGTEWLKGREECVFLRRIRMMKRLTIILFAFAAYGVPASAESLSTFAHDGAGRSVLEFDPASVSAFSAKGHALMRVAVKETPSENEPHGPTDLTVIIDCRLRQMT